MGNLRLTRELLRVIKTFKSHKIGVIVVGGPVLANSAYGNLSFMQLLNLEFFVRFSDILKVKDFLGIIVEEK
ncbi:MAG: nucleotidyltransferase family protein [Methanobacteriaceae archaeon]